MFSRRILQSVANTVTTNFAISRYASLTSITTMITAMTSAKIPSMKSTIARRNSCVFSCDISLILIINYFLLLLCCDVCKSNEYSSLSSTRYDNIMAQRHENLAALASVGDAAASRVSVASAIIDKINLNSNLTDLKHGAVQKHNTAAAAGRGGGSNENIINVNSNKTIENITNSCMARCKQEETLFLDEFGIKCATGDLHEKCFITRCNKGCQQWLRALQEYESCQEACSSLQFYPFDLPCIGACEMAQRNYWHLQRLAMESLVRNTIPQLLYESATAGTTTMLMPNSLTLQWPIKFPDKYLASRPFNIQYCYVRKHKDNVEERRKTVNVDDIKHAATACTEADWSNLADYNCVENFNCDILDVLMPYTSYSFRYEFPFGESPTDILYSTPTPPFTTPAEGAPLSSPIIKNVLALDDAHIAIFWQDGEFTNGPLTGYKLHMTNANSNATLEQLIPSTQQQYIATNLLPLTNYTLQLCMLNAEGAGPCALSWVMTKDLPHIKGTDMYAASEFILAGEYSIRLRSLEALAETQLIYLSDQLISDYALHLAAKKLFVIDEDGHVFKAHLEKSTEREALYLNKSIVNFKPAKIAADWLNSKLYLAGQAPNKFWLIVRSDMRGEKLELLASAQHHAVQQLVVDPINGWLFWTQSNAGIRRMNLATLKQETILQRSTLGSFVVDFARNLLVYYDKEDQELYELSYDGGFKQKLRHGINSKNNSSGALQGELQSFALSSGADIYATNGTHLAHQNYRTNENDIWFIRELEWCWSFVPQQQRQLQPIPQPTGSPRAVQALLTANMAKISWQPPTQNALQTAYAWQQWEYELELMDVASNSAFNIRNIQSTYFDVKQLQADNNYKLRVRAVSKTSAGPWSEELLTRTWPLGKHKLLWATAQGFYETNEVGQEVQALLDNKVVVADVTTFVQLNGSIFFVANETLKCANLMNPELSCAFKLGITGGVKVSALSYDWRGGKIYLTDTQRNLLVRANLDGSDKELLPLFDAQQIEIDSYAGHVYYSTGARLARRTLSGSSSYERQEAVYFHVNGIGGVVRGFALDVTRQQIYFVARQNEGHVRLFKAATERGGGELHKFQNILLSEDIVTGTLAYIEDIDSLLWLTATKNSSRLVIVRTDNLAQQAYLDVPQFGRQIRAVKLKRDYMPYLDASVVPEAIAADSIQVDEDGYWDDFNIKWATSMTADNYTVFYKILLQYSDERAQLTRFYTLEVNEPMLRLTEFHQPQLRINISITPHTYWRAGPTVSVQLHTPAAAPTQPKRLRVFISQTADPLLSAPNISALIRWDPPENISVNTAVAYKVYCWLGDELYRERLHNYTSGGDKSLEARIGELSAGETYTFQVQAFAVGRASGGEKTAQHAVHVNPEVQAAPILLIATSEYIAEFDLDLNRRRILVHTASEVEHLILMQGEQRLLWVNENVELLTFVPGSAPVKLARMRAEVLALTADWVTRTVYWAELDADIEAVSIYKLDLCQFEGRVMLGTKIFRTARGRLLRDMLVLPFSQTLLWLEYDAVGRNATLMGRNLTDGALLKFKGATALLRMFEGSLGPEMETVNLLDHKGKLCKYDVQRLICTPLKLQFDLAELLEKTLQVERDNGYVYALQNGSIRAYNRRKLNLEYELDAFDVRRIKAFNYQEYPPRSCLLPSEPDVLLSKPDLLDPQVIALEEDFFTLELPELNIDDTCWLPVPGVHFMINVADNSADYQRNLTTFEHVVNITDLTAYTNYTVQVHVSTYYQLKLDLVVPKIPDFIVRTAAGTPSLPQNFTAYALSPTEIHVHWRQPAELNNAKVWYELHWQMENSSLGAYKKVEGISVILTNMTPSQRYALWLKVFSTRAKFEVTSSLVVETFEQPPVLQLLSRGPDNLTLHWLPPTDVSSTMLVCQQLNADENEFSIDITNKSEQVVITELEPKTKYEFHLELYYPHVARPYQFPERFIFETLGDHPSSPGKPQIEHISGEIFMVSWEPARSNGSPVTEYSLEALQSRLMVAAKRKRRSSAPDNENVVDETAANSTVISMRDLLPWAEELQPLEDKWLVYCNTTELSCIVRDLYTMRLLMFRVRARNEAYGWGPYSEDSVRVIEPFVTPEKRDSLVFAIIAPAAIVSSCVLMLLVFRIVQKRRIRAKKLLEKGRPSIWSNFSTLQQQQLMSTRNRAFSVASHSTLYTGGPLSDADIALLPHINWSQITLQNFLGSGAFGEVYEGLVKHEDEEEQEKVAIKTLRKGANEFAELLQEAQLMSNFKHENIVRLIGVCFDTESISIIMEHMEGGDLLSYLRESRPNSLRPNSSLQLLDLMSMCIDVATGCSYLEDMHFVHRDLACRNCLVSSRDRSKRVVKIGDFGLARDIYKNDYYRKEGEGLLPVRWMSPESLVDGVFTTQSDVWAFAVLCWEILTLGQQPYAARNNLDVLNYVKSGGRLELPENCPDKLFTLMLQCWLTDPEERPSFRKCLNMLLAVKTDVRRISMGYSKDDDVYATYVNNQGIVLSTFLANPLPKLDEEEDDVGASGGDVETTTAASSCVDIVGIGDDVVVGIDATPTVATTAADVVNEKTNMKVRFQTSISKEDSSEGSINDESKLIEQKPKNKNEEPNYYINEAISRL